VTTLVWVLARQLRSRWRNWALVAVLVGLAGAVVLTAAAGARRTDSAYQRFLDTAHAADVLVSPSNTGFGGYYDALARLPSTETVAPIIGVQALPYFLPGPKLVEAPGLRPRRPALRQRDRTPAGRLGAIAGSDPGPRGGAGPQGGAAAQRAGRRHCHAGGHAVDPWAAQPAATGTAALPPEGGGHLHDP